MRLLNYGTKIPQDNKSRAGWTDNYEDKKTRALTTRTKKLSGQKGIYHQVEFRL